MSPVAGSLAATGRPQLEAFTTGRSIAVATARRVMKLRLQAGDKKRSPSSVS